MFNLLFFTDTFSEIILTQGQNQTLLSKPENSFRKQFIARSSKEYFTVLGICLVQTQIRNIKSRRIQEYKLKYKLKST